MLVPERAKEDVIRAALPWWLRSLRHGLDLVAAALIAAAMTVLAGIFALMNLEIFARTILGRSTLIADEYAGYGFAFIIMAGLIFAHRSGALLNVDAAVRRFEPRWRAGALTLASLVSLALCAFSAYAGYKLWGLSYLFGSTSAFASDTPLWIPQLVVPVGFALLSLSFTEEFCSRAMLAAKGR